MSTPQAQPSHRTFFPHIPSELAFGGQSLPLEIPSEFSADAAAPLGVWDDLIHMLLSKYSYPYLTVVLLKTIV